MKLVHHIYVIELNKEIIKGNEFIYDFVKGIEPLVINRTNTEAIEPFNSQGIY